MNTQDIEIAITFDMTCSMLPCIYQVKQELERFLNNIKNKIQNIKFGIITHGDYDSSRYVINKMDFNDNLEYFKNYIQNVESAGSNFWNDGECYEKVLSEAKTLSWSENSKKILIVIGDDIPHTPFSSVNKENIDWRKELQDLHNMNIETYGVNAPTLSRRRSEFFYSALSEKSLNGKIIPLDQFIYIVDILLALIYKNCDSNNEMLQQFEETIQQEDRYNRNMEIVFNNLLDREDQQTMCHVVNNSSGSVDDLIEISPTEFQILTVDDNISIKDIVVNSGAEFKVGNGFYQLSKTESVSEKKKVILFHKNSGNFYTGNQARNILGLPFSGTVKIKPSNVPSEYIAFIQSKSSTRGLKKNTKFLYKVDSGMPQ